MSEIVKQGNDCTLLEILKQFETMKKGINGVSDIYVIEWSIKEH